MKILFLLVILMACPMISSASDTSAPRSFYTLSMPKPANHLFEVEALFTNIAEGTGVLDVLLPVWRPGRYLILDFADGVQNFSAFTADGQPLRWHKANKSAWRIETHGALSVTVRYKVFANEFNKKTRGLDIDHAFVSGESVFMYTDANRSFPNELTVLPFGPWHVTTGLDDAGRQNAFVAPTYDHLIDCPLEIGTQQDIAFTVKGKRHVISLSGRGNWNADTLVRDFTKLIEANYRFWGTLPYEKYVFLFHCLPSNGGGVEHINSAVMGVRSWGFQNPSTYQQFLSLVSHEYFHTWNVKQLRPHGLHPYDLQHENYSNELWIAEGTTSYYGQMMLVSAGFRAGRSTLDMAAAYAYDERSRPGNTVLSLSDASYDAWIKYWHANENSYNAESDYYGKGSMVSLLLDLELRQRSHNTSSLDRLMRLMFTRFPLSGSGYSLADFQHAAEECAGGSMEDFFSLYVRGTAPLPWEATLLYAGVDIKPKDAPLKPSFGWTTQAAGEKLKVMRVITDSPAEEAGLETGDEIAALNGIRVHPADIEERLGELKDGTRVRITFFRDDMLRETTVTARKFGSPQYTAQQIQSPTPLQTAIFESWLSTPWHVQQAQK